MLTKEETKFKDTEIGLIPNEWDVKPASKVLEVIGGGTPKTTVDQYWNGEIPWLSVVDFNSDIRFVYKTEKTITELGLKESSTKILNKGMLIISARGTVGALAQLGNDMAFNQSCYGLNGKDIENDFLYYALKNQINNIKQNTHGAVFDTITRSTFDTIFLPLPPLSEQKSIAEILSSLDEKIELNRRMNKTLEEMGKALFKRWVVDFEFPNENGKPYKSSDGKMIDSELGEIPEGWGVARIADVSKVVTGMTPSKDQSYYYGEQIPFVTPSDYKGYDVYISKTDRYLIEVCESKFDKILVPKNGIMVTCIGSDMGKVALSYKPSLTNQQINSVIFPKEHKCLSTYLYYELKAKYPILRSMADGGSTMPIVNKSSFENLLFINPAQNLVSSFYDLMILLFETVLDNSMQIEKLQKTKDLLLPKLILGRIRTL